MDLQGKTLFLKLCASCRKVSLAFAIWEMEIIWPQWWRHRYFVRYDSLRQLKYLGNKVVHKPEEMESNILLNTTNDLSNNTKFRFFLNLHPSGNLRTNRWVEDLEKRVRNCFFSCRYMRAWKKMFWEWFSYITLL